MDKELESQRGESRGSHQIVEVAHEDTRWCLCVFTTQQLPLGVLLCVVLGDPKKEWEILTIPFVFLLTLKSPQSLPSSVCHTL